MSLSVGGVEKALRDPALALGAQMAVESSQRTNKAQDINACLSLTPCQRFLNANTLSGGTLESHTVQASTALDGSLETVAFFSK